MRLTVRGEYRSKAWEITAATAKLGEAIAGLARWPLDVQVAFAGATATLHGSWTPDPIGVQGDLSLKTPTAERLLEATGATPPKLGALELSTRLAASPGNVSLDAMQFAGSVGAISGEAHASWSGERPKIDVNVTSQEIDYAAFERWRSASRGTGSVETILERVLERLRAVDGSLTATVAQVKNAPVFLKRRDRPLV